MLRATIPVQAAIAAVQPALKQTNVTPVRVENTFSAQIRVSVEIAFFTDRFILQIP